VSSSKSSSPKQESGGASQASFASLSPSAYPSNGNGTGHPNGNGRAHAIGRNGRAHAIGRNGKSHSTGSWTPTAAGASRFAKR